MLYPIRTLRSSEWNSFCDHLLRLNNVDRRLRFGAALNDDSIKAFVRGIEPSKTAIFAHFDTDLRVVGAVQLSFLPASGGEAAFSVDAWWRRKGLGKALAQRAILSARNKGIDHVCCFCFSANYPMRRLAVGEGLPVERQDTEWEATGYLSAPSLISVIHELTGEQSGWYDYAAKSFWRAWTWHAPWSPAT